MKHSRPDYQRIQDPAGLIPADEPVFLLRGQDRYAPDTLRDYASRIYNRGKGDAAAMRDIYAHADAMEAWQRDHASKVPDAPRIDEAKTISTSPPSETFTPRHVPIFSMAGRPSEADHLIESARETTLCGIAVANLPIMARGIWTLKNVPLLNTCLDCLRLAGWPEKFAEVTDTDELPPVAAALESQRDRIEVVAEGRSGLLPRDGMGYE